MPAFMGDSNADVEDPFTRCRTVEEAATLVAAERNFVGWMGDDGSDEAEENASPHAALAK